MRTLLLLTLFTFCLKTICACPRPPYRNITVIDRTSQKTIPNVQITLEENGKIIEQAITDSTGTLDFWGYDETFRIRISHAEYLAFVTTLRTNANCHIYVTVQLSKNKRNIIRIKEIQRIRIAASDEIFTSAKANLNADVTKDENFNKSTCMMQHYSRKAMQTTKPGTHLFNEVLAYPNPVTEGIIYVESKFDTNKILVIYNLAGNELLRTEIVLHQSIDTSQLPPGIYFLKVIDEKNDDVTVKKIVIP